MSNVNPQSYGIGHRPLVVADYPLFPQAKSAGPSDGVEHDAAALRQNGETGQSAAKEMSFAGAHRELAHCRQCLADNKRDIDRHVSLLARNRDRAGENLRAAGVADNSQDPAQHLRQPRSAPDFEFNQEWQLSHKAAADKFNEILAADEKTFKSYGELWQDAVNGIGTIEDQYLGVYENVVERYTAFYSDFSDFMSGLTAFLNVTTDDKGNQTMQFKPEVIAEINKLINDYANGSKGVLFPASGTATKAEADKWAKELGLDPACVQPSGVGYVVRVDLSPLLSIRDNLNDSAIKPMTTFEYQSWRSGFDAQSGKLQTTLQTLTTKYGNANGMFDTMVKVLSSSITSGSETLKQILASM